MDYIQINITLNPKHPWIEVITQELADIDFESFIEEGEELQAYINKENFNEQRFQTLINSYTERGIEIDFTRTLIPSQNWNATWESDYEAVKIEKRLLIRAPFHPIEEGYKLSIEIQPQMSFGTGHHQTTYLLSKALLDLDFNDKKVLDVGTGTGILGILAAKLGAIEILGTDIEEEAIENAKENAERNSITNFELIKGDIDRVPNIKYDVIIANINKNVLLRHLTNYADLIIQNGLLLLSGFFKTDAEELITAAAKHDFDIVNTLTKEEWAVLVFQKK